MYWIKRFAPLMILTIGLSGCAIGVKASITPNPAKGKVYMEYIDNNEFLEFVLENDIVEGLKREDVIYVDNILTSDVAYPPWSSKLILAKDALYEVKSEHKLFWLNYELDLEKLKKIYLKTSGKPRKPYWTIPVSTCRYVTPEYILKTEIRSGDCFFCDCKDSKVYSSCDELSIIVERKSEVKWYQRKWYYHWYRIPHRFNDIHKIKAVFDERVAYFLSLENNQTNTTSADQ